MKKLLLFLKLLLFSVLLSGQVINLDPSSLGSLDALMTANGIRIYVSVLNTTGVETGSIVYPYNTIQEALDVCTGGEVILVYPGTYTETITFADNNVSVMGVGDPSNVIITQADANVVNFANTNNSSVTNFTISLTAPTDATKDLISITAPGTATVRFCNLTLATAATISSADQPHIANLLYNVAGLVELNIEYGNVTYAHTGTTTTGVKTPFYCEAGATLRLRWIGMIDINNSGTAAATAIFADETSGTIIMHECNADVDDNDATITAGFGYLTGSATNIEFSYNDIHVHGEANNVYGIYVTDPEVRLEFNHIHSEISDVGNAYGLTEAGTGTITSQFDDIIATGGSSGNLVYVNSPSDGDLSVSDDIFLADGGVVGITANERLVFNAAGNITVTGADLALGGNNISGVADLTTTGTTIIGTALNPDTNEGAYIGLTGSRFNWVYGDTIYANVFTNGSNFTIGGSGDEITVNADLFRIGYLASDNTVVVSPNATGDLDTLETSDLAVEDITVTGDWSFQDITSVDTIVFENGAILHNDVADTLYLIETVTKVTGELEVIATTEQLRLSYDPSNYLTVTLLADGHTTFVTADPDGAEADINFTPDGNVGIKTAAPGTALEVTGTVTASTGFTDGTFTVDGSGNFTAVDDFTYNNGAVFDNIRAGNLTITEDTITIEGVLIADHSGGMSYISTEGTQTIGTGGTFEKLFEGAMAYTAAHLDDFTESNGRLTYDGTITKHFKISVHASIESDEAQARVQIRIAKDGTTIAESDAAHDFTAVDTDATFASNWLMELATNEYIEVFGTSDTTGDTFVVHTLTLIITEM